MAPSAYAFDQGTGRSNYSSVHSLDAYVGDFQVMYTPGNSPPQRRKASSRFKSTRHTDTHTRIIPPAIPDTSQILPDYGPLRDVHVHYSIPADEKQIVASLRSLEQQLDSAVLRIEELEKARDQAIQERDDALRQLRRERAAFQKATSSTKKQAQVDQIEEELFDLSRVEDSESPKKSTLRSAANKRSSTNAGRTTTENDARVLSPTLAERVEAMSPQLDRRASTKNASSKDRRNSKKVNIQEIEQSMVEDATGVSNTSRRRRRHSLEDNMTSAYILPDITLAMKQQQDASKGKPSKASVSQEAHNLIRDHDPQHIDDCEVCKRLTAKQQSHVRTHANSKMTSAAKRTTSTNIRTEGDYTAQVTAMMRDIALEDPTMRPKIAPKHALEHLKKLLNDQFAYAKKKHGEAWDEYDAIDAPKNSKRHDKVGQELEHWAKKMEECRVNLDQLRDVEEGMKGTQEL